MKKLMFHYNMSLSFSSPAKSHNFMLKCIPKSNLRQTVESVEFEVFPRCDVSCSEDCFGNLTRYGCIADEHNHFDVSVQGICTADGDKCSEAVNPGRLGLFRVPTPLTSAGKAIRDFCCRFDFPDEKNNLEKAHIIMQSVYTHFQYTPRSTNINTTAEEAFELQKGVCQDYSQVMLAVCRVFKIPCRYVTGLLMGEGETHAWVEVEHNGNWYGFDPTNGIVVGDGHIVVSTGRDSADCSINRGVFCGGGEQTQKIYVKVEELNDTDCCTGSFALR